MIQVAFSAVSGEGPPGTSVHGPRCRRLGDDGGSRRIFFEEESMSGGVASARWFRYQKLPAGLTAEIPSVWEHGQMSDRDKTKSS